MSNLYMTTEEFAAMIVDTLHEQNYFKKGSKNHPGDLVIAFTSAAETIATAMEWAIAQEGKVNQKKAMMRTSTLAKNTSGSWSSQNVVLPMDEEIAPALLEEGESILPEDYSFDYSEWRWKKKA